MVVKQKEIRIGVVGINVANQNTYLSLEQALKVAKTALEMNLKIVYIDV
jgi:CTP synthase (UTP-ammonia lyase)